MNLKTCIWSIVSLFLFVGRSEGAKAAKPNFIFMLMDDMGWGDLGVNGEPHQETPNIDQMAREGMIATSMYASAPLCSPSRAAFLTGRLPIRNGFYSDNLRGRNAYTPQNIVGGISKDEILLPEVLGKVGYKTGLIGKWHLGHHTPYLPTERGFDFFFGSTNCHFGPFNDKSKPNIPVFRNSSMIGRYYEEFPIDHVTGISNMTRYFTEEAVDFIHREADNPFFLYWAPDATHDFAYASEEFRGSSRRGKYGDAVKELDAGVGAILEALREEGIENNTLVVFSSDNGPALVSKFDGGDAGPFLCGKQTTFEGGMREPGIFWWPGIIKAGTTTPQLWNHMDLFSTFIELGGGELPKDRILDGLSLANALHHPELEVTRPMFFYRGDLLMAVRQGSFKMHLWTWSTPTEELEQGINYCPGFHSENFTTSEQTDHSARPILFNIDKDPMERYPLNTNSHDYNMQIPKLLEVVIDHRAKLVKGEPQLNWCDPAVMHWAPPGCEALGKCLPVPQSNRTRCYWPH